MGRTEPTHREKNVANLQIKITLAELEKIAGGENPAEAQLVLRQSIAGEFAKRYLGKAIDAEIQANVATRVEQATSAVRTEQENLIRAEYGRLGIIIHKDNRGNFTATLTQPIYDAIRAEVAKSQETLIAHAVRAYCTSEDNTARVKAEIERRVQSWNRDQIHNGVTAALNKALGVSQF